MYNHNTHEKRIEWIDHYNFSAFIFFLESLLNSLHQQFPQSNILFSKAALTEEVRAFCFSRLKNHHLPSALTRTTLPPLLPGNLPIAGQLKILPFEPKQTNYPISYNRVNYNTIQQFVSFNNFEELSYHLTTTLTRPIHSLLDLFPYSSSCCLVFISNDPDSFTQDHIVESITDYVIVFIRHSSIAVLSTISNFLKRHPKIMEEFIKIIPTPFYHVATITNNSCYLLINFGLFYLFKMELGLLLPITRSSFLPQFLSHSISITFFSVTTLWFRDLIIKLQGQMACNLLYKLIAPSKTNQTLRCQFQWDKLSTLQAVLEYYGSLYKQQRDTLQITENDDTWPNILQVSLWDYKNLPIVISGEGLRALNDLAQLPSNQFIEITPLNRDLFNTVHYLWETQMSYKFDFDDPETNNGDDDENVSTLSDNDDDDDFLISSSDDNLPLPKPTPKSCQWILFQFPLLSPFDKTKKRHVVNKHITNLYYLYHCYQKNLHTQKELFANSSLPFEYNNHNNIRDDNDLIYPRTTTRINKKTIQDMNNILLHELGIQQKENDQGRAMKNLNLIGFKSFTMSGYENFESIIEDNERIGTPIPYNQSKDELVALHVELQYKSLINHLTFIAQMIDKYFVEQSQEENDEQLYDFDINPTLTEDMNILYSDNIETRVVGTKQKRIEDENNTRPKKRRRKYKQERTKKILKTKWTNQIKTGQQIYSHQRALRYNSKLYPSDYTPYRKFYYQETTIKTTDRLRQIKTQFNKHLVQMLYTTLLQQSPQLVDPQTSLNILSSIRPKTSLKKVHKSPVTQRKIARIVNPSHTSNNTNIKHGFAWWYMDKNESFSLSPSAKAFLFKILSGTNTNIEYESPNKNNYIVWEFEKGKEEPTTDTNSILIPFGTITETIYLSYSLSPACPIPLSKNLSEFFFSELYLYWLRYVYNS